MDVKRISFIGLGLIGGSLALAIKKHYPDIKLISHASLKTVKKAYEMGLCENDRIFSPKELCDSEIIVLCAPVEVNVSYLYILKEFLNENHILTDVGSVKGDIQKAVDKAGLSHIFVGGHPMAGSEKTGIENSSPELIENCRYILTTKDTASDSPKLDLLLNFISNLGSRVIKLTPEDHDRAAAGISHVPHILASGLVNMVGREDKNGLMKTMAATGFRDTTRIASGDSEIWQQIALANKDAILELLESFINNLSSFKTSLSENDLEGVLNFFKTAKEIKDDWNS